MKKPSPIRWFFYLHDMKVISTNIGEPTAITWNGKAQKTGIFKSPVQDSILLQKESVSNDTIADRKVHGGIYKACYLFATEQYPYWKEKYPNLDWDWGMFGENLTVEGLNEETIKIGSIYRLGTALVQVTQPREPCFKLGIRFDNMNILKEFITHGYPGTYIRVLEEGSVKKGDVFELQKESSNPLTTKQFFDLLYAKEKDIALVNLALENEALPLYKRERLKKFIKKERAK